MTISAWIIIIATALFLVSLYTKEYSEDTRKYVSKKRKNSRTYRR